MGSVITNATEFVRNELLKDNEICKFTTGIKDLRKIIASLKCDGFVIYDESCECGLDKRKHKSYIRDWAV
tara:strand:- start:172 stop:381 length:210 start_codon:yes stop_codon:yes gene_type:complete